MIFINPKDFDAVRYEAPKIVMKDPCGCAGIIPVYEKTNGKVDRKWRLVRGIPDVRTLARGEVSVLREFNLSPDQVFGKSRKQIFVFLRFLCVAILVTYSNMSREDVGKLLGMQTNSRYCYIRSALDVWIKTDSRAYDLYKRYMQNLSDILGCNLLGENKTEALCA